MSPVCLGITGDPATVLAAYEAGVNFFFLTADLHWPLYEPTRRGLAELFTAHPGARDEVVVAAVSYLGQPLFEALQLHEVIGAVPGLGRIDVMLAGAVSGDHDCVPRLHALAAARARGHAGARSIGATFHSRAHALYAVSHGAVEIAFVRYNPRHPGARRDLFPFLPTPGFPLAFGFKSTMYHVPDEVFTRAGAPSDQWRPRIADHYRFALSSPFLQGVLASPMRPSELRELHDALGRGALTPEEDLYMMQLAAAAYPRRPLVVA